MKKIILFLAIGFFAITANAQKINEAAVPAPLKAAFVKLYPTAAVSSWTKEPVNNIRAEFVNAGVGTSVLMGPNNNLLETKIEIKASEFPKTAADYCSDKSITKSYKITSYTGAVTYQAFGKAEYNFDKDGAVKSK